MNDKTDGFIHYSLIKSRISEMDEDRLRYMFSRTRSILRRLTAAEQDRDRARTRIALVHAVAGLELERIHREKIVRRLTAKLMEILPVGWNT